MADNAKYITFTDENFEQEVLSSDQPVLVDFWATWCPPCRLIAPAVEELAGEYEGRAKVGKLDVDEQQQIAARYNIRSVPTLLFFKNGTVADQVVGAVSKQELSNRLNALIEKTATV